MMERLTDDYGKKFSPFRYAMKDGSDSEIGYFKNYDAFYSHMLMVQKLGEYEDLEEQGLLLRLPCKVGDAVWDSHYGKPCAYTITGFSFGAGEYYIDEPVTEKEVVCYCSNSNENITISFAVSEIGKTIFLTQAEAEQKLKEMEKVEKR